ncbi:MAG: DUF6516 family protein [Betaproteobacteria bacterium]|nr:DUF6516 family protein [Betaproteobacteria bacterium]
MNAHELIRRRVILSSDSFADIVVWQVPQPVSGCSHAFKYRLAFVVKGVCMLRYDNEVDKGDHKHFGNDEMRYEFFSPRQLVADFMNDVRRWQDEHSHT